MHPEAAFLAGYALSLTFVAVGLGWLGRRSSDPWASRTLAACRPPAEQRSHDGSDWPHSDVPAFYLGLAAVALIAAFVITALSAVRHAGLAELVIHSALLVIVSVRIRHLIIEHRTSAQLLRRPATPGSEPEIAALPTDHEQCSHRPPDSVALTRRASRRPDATS